MLYRAYNFPARAAGLAAIEALPEGAAADIDRIGQAFDEGEGSDLRPGWFCNVVWTGEEAPGWAAARIPPEAAPRWWSRVPRVEVPLPSLDDYQAAIDALIQATARSRGYNDAATCAGYALDPNPVWRDEGAAFIAWRSAAYQAAFATLAVVQAGTMPAPSVEEFVASLPAMEWPA